MRIFRILVAPVKREQQFLESYWISPEKNSIRIPIGIWTNLRRKFPLELRQLPVKRAQKVS
jgi:hypothetical protein